MSVENTLQQIDVWFGEPSEGQDRAKLLSKLALLELCGWIELEIDRIVLSIQTACRIPVDQTTKDLLQRNYSFTYPQHIRPMLERLVGIWIVRQAEDRIEERSPGELERLKGVLGDLAKRRNVFAHTHVSHVAIRQLTYLAPSWTRRQFQTVNNGLQLLEVSFRDTVSSHLDMLGASSPP